MMRFTLFALALAASPLVAAEEGFVSLFDGKSLDGWKVSEHPDSFSVKDGMLVAKGPRAHAFFLGEDGEAKFGNFELRLEVMTKENSNGGVYFHTAWQETGWPKWGYEAQVNNTHEDPKKSGGLYGLADNPEPFKDNEWMEYVVRFEDGVINVTVNGKHLVKDFKAEEGQCKMAEGGGTFGLQAHDPGSTVFYRNIRVKELD